MTDIPVTVILVTKNEAKRLERCLDALGRFQSIIVVDSMSRDGSERLAQSYANTQFTTFEWNGTYPKKRQWCLDHLGIETKWVFFVDADEIVTDALCDTIAQAVQKDQADGYFVSGRYVLDKKMLRFGLRNNKLCLFKRDCFAFPVIDDLEAGAMGELEGHYQPHPIRETIRIAQIKPALIHEAMDAGWCGRHRRYAKWEAYMIYHKLWPDDPVAWRNIMKRIFRHMPFRWLWAFMHSYVLKFGCFDGRAGWRFACHRAWYYRQIDHKLSALKRGSGRNSSGVRAA